METKICKKCHISIDVANFYKDKRNKDGLQCWCKKCFLEHNKKNLIKWKKENIAYRKIYEKQYEKTHKTQRYNYRAKQRNLILEHYGKRCNICGFDKDIDCLTIDHINGGGNKHYNGLGLTLWLIKNNFPDGFQVLCMNCQSIKRIENKECCHISHKSPKNIIINQRNYNRKLKKEVILHYGNKCIECKYDDNIEALQLDHINNNGSKHKIIAGKSIYKYLKKNNYPNKEPFLLQVLCANCNHKKEKLLRKNKIC